MSRQLAAVKTFAWAAGTANSNTASATLQPIMKYLLKIDLRGEAEMVAVTVGFDVSARDRGLSTGRDLNGCRMH